MRIADVAFTRGRRSRTCPRPIAARYPAPSPAAVALLLTPVVVVTAAACSSSGEATEGMAAAASSDDLAAERADVAARAEAVKTLLEALRDPELRPVVVAELERQEEAQAAQGVAERAVAGGTGGTEGRGTDERARLAQEAAEARRRVDVATARPRIREALRVLGEE